MRAIAISVVVSVPAVAAVLACAPSARADDDPPHRLGDHPAIVVQRLQKTAGYDYASKFYPHPAWMRLYAEQPRDVAESPPIAGGTSEVSEVAAPTPPAALKVSAGS